MNCTEHCVVPPELKRQNLSKKFFCKCRMSLKIKSSNRNQAACELQQVTAHCVGLNLTKRRKRHGVTRAFNKQNKFDHIFLNKCNLNPYIFFQAQFFFKNQTSKKIVTLSSNISIQPTGLHLYLIKAVSSIWSIYLYLYPFHLASRQKSEIFSVGV